jgi:hypothetical protein
VFISLYDCNNQSGESVFIISKHSAPSQAQAYRIDGDQVMLQDTVEIDTYNQGYGAVGNAVWNDKELMFVTYEESPMIVWASTATLEKVGEFNTGMTDLAGIVVDEGAEYIYVVQRETDNLYVYSFDEGMNTLVLEEHVHLAKPASNVVLVPFGLALDETNGWIYVSYSYTDDETPPGYFVEVYRTSDWGHDHYVPINVDGTYRAPIGIAVDPGRYLYTGNWTEHTYLVRTATTSPYTSIEANVGMPVIGIDVDESTGLVYCTTYHHDFRVYESNGSFVLKDTESVGISGPAGVAVGGHYKENVFSLSKDDGGLTCVSPEDVVDYTIEYGANGYSDTSVWIIDYLPIEVDYVSCSDGGSYDAGTHTVTWYIGNISAYASGTREIQVQVNYLAPPAGTITNIVTMEGDDYRGKATKETNVCCYVGDTIYVDKDATGYNNGTSWDDAYTDLQDALALARECPDVGAIWVAAGTYSPTTDPYDSSASFELVDGVDLFGHFAGDESSPSGRDLGNPNNETVLEGQIGQYNFQAVIYVVKGENIQDAVLDGFTVTGSYGYPGAGIFLNDFDGGIVNCTLTDNDDYGIKCQAGSSLTITESTIQNNNVCGIDADNATLTIADSIFNSNGRNAVYTNTGCNLTIERSIVSYSGWDGLSLNYDNTTIIKNNWIHDNGTNPQVEYRSGIWLGEPVSVPVIRNNTICNNFTYGIEESEEGADPQILNCIIYDNGSGDLFRDNGSFGDVTYCCLQSPHGGPEDKNITDDPSFVNPGAGDYHLTYDSPCVNWGKEDSTGPGETDIDGDPRVISEVVDMGADETECLPDCHADYNEWILMGRPRCWCDSPIDGTHYQCHGDADGATEGLSKFRIYGNDLALVVANWKRKIDDPLLNRCADIDHKSETLAKFRVYGNDLAIVVANWKKKDYELTNNCNECDRGQQARGGGEVKIEELLKRLLEIWLDPEVQKLIDEDAWLKFVESLKQDIENPPVNRQ